MRDAFDAFVGRGGNAAILSGNTSFWQVRFDPGHRGMTGYKYRADEDPVLGHGGRTLPDGLLVRPPHRPARDLDDRPHLHAGRLLEVRARRPRRARAPTRCTDRSTGRSRGPGCGAGQEFGGADAIVAYECDGCAFETGPDGLPVPTGVDGAPEGLEILATAPAHLWAQHEQPTRYAHEPGELEQCSMAVFGDASPEHLAELGDGHAVMAAFERPGAARS